MKKIISLILICCMMATVFPLSVFATAIVASGYCGGEGDGTNLTWELDSAGTLSVGDYITFGTYLDQPIVWRCVGIDENGPLMLSDKILCLKAFDAAGTSDIYHTDDWGYIRKQRGSNCWSDSSIRQWLNSSDSVVNYTHCPPNSTNVLDGHNAYDSEAGFLVGFTKSEISLIKSVTNVVNINDWETHRSGYCDGGSSILHLYSPSQTDIDYSNYYYQNVTDKIFLLTATHADTVYQFDADYFEYAYPTKTAVENSTYKADDLSPDKPWCYSLANPHQNNDNCFELVSIVNYIDVEDVYSRQAHCGLVGIRPAFYLTTDNLQEIEQATGGSLSSDNKYLSVEINNTGKSYFVGDEIRFFIYDCTETEDDYLHWTKPEGLAIQISDNETISLKKHTEYDDFTECVFVADKPGVVTVSLSDNITSTPINVTLHITEDKYQSLRADNVPTYEYDSIINKDFYNTYVNGMYVTDFTYRSNSNGTYTFEFTVYNETYAPGVVEVYDGEGNLQKIKTIEKFSNPSSLKDAIFGAWNVIVDIKNGDTFTFRDVSNSKETPVSVEVPADGYVIVTNSTAESPTCLLVSLLDYIFTGASLIESTVKIDAATFDEIIRETTQEIFSKDMGKKILEDFQKKFLITYGQSALQKQSSAVYALVLDNINLFFNTVDIDLISIIENSMVGAGFSALQGLIQKGGGPAASALSGIFVVLKILNFELQTTQIANNALTNSHF